MGNSVIEEQREAEETIHFLGLIVMCANET